MRRRPEVLGLLIAGFIAVVRFGFGKDFAYIYGKATDFLFKWYLFSALLMVVISAVVVMTGSFTVGFAAGGIIGALTGGVVGSVMAAGVIGAIVLGYALQTVGAKLLRDALSVNPDGSHSWDDKMIVVGAVLLCVGLFILPLKN